MEIMEIILLITLIVVVIVTRTPKKEKPKTVLTKEQKRDLEKAKKAFNNLMKYDYDDALKGKE